jgi:cytoskeletal protein RodZ
VDDLQESLEPIQQITQAQEQLAQLMPLLMIGSAVLLVIILVSGAIGVYRKHKINKAIMETQQDVKDIKAMLQKQSTSYLSNVSTTNANSSPTTNNTNTPPTPSI